MPSHPTDGRASRVPPTPLATLAALVLKRGVALGGLTHPERLLALRVMADALPHGVPRNEAEVNAALRERLGAEGSFLDVDHVELRRWLIDTGWWQRDGYGRQYARTPLASLPPDLAAVEAEVAPLALSAWIDEQRGRAQALREARREAWRRSGAAGAPAGTAGL